MELLADTTFLIDLQRGEGAAKALLQERAADEFIISIITIGELVPGFVRHGESVLSLFLQPFPVISITERTAWLYGEIFSNLRKIGALIGSNDLWIAASALEHKLPVVTRNTAHFHKIRELEVISY